MTFRILISGSRDWDDQQVIEQALGQYEFLRDVTLVSGGCPSGADWMCENFARSLDWNVEVHAANWQEYGKRAGFIRNSIMVNSGADICYVFIKNHSRGATMTKDLIVRAGMLIEVFTA